MSLKLNSSGGGSVTLQEPTTANNQTLTLPDNTGTLVSTASQPSFASTIAVGGATPSVSGAGITFPATQSASSDANTLDDYEEGTFTPTFNTSNSDLANFGYFVQYGQYTKVGNFVTVFIRLATINAGSISGTGDVEIRGLPFGVATNSSGVNALALTHDNRWSTNPQFAQSQRLTTAVTLYKNNLIQSGGSSALQRTDFNPINTGNYNIVTILWTYFVA